MMTIRAIVSSPSSRRRRRPGPQSSSFTARKAWLKGLSPKENREIPELDYEIVAELKRTRPDLEIILNGGVADLATAERELSRMDGVMLGRAAYHEPALLLEVDSRIFGDSTPARSADQAALDFRPWIIKRLEQGASLHSITRHMLGPVRRPPWRTPVASHPVRESARRARRRCDRGL